MTVWGRRGLLGAVLLVLGAAVPAAGQGASPPACRGIPATIWGSGGADVLVGTDGADVIVGLRGADVIRAGGGDDLICAGGGDDVVYAGAGDDVVWAGTGRDLIYGAAGDDAVRGGPGDDRLLGGVDDDTLHGQGGSDWVHGGFGRDVLQGGPGSDVLIGHGGRDRLQGRAGDDALDGGAGPDRMAGGAGVDVLAGGDDADTLSGGEDDDVLDGGPGADAGNAGSGADLCRELEDAARCNESDPGLWEWVRTTQAGALADRIQSVVVLQTGCETPLDLDWLAVAAGVFPDAAGGDLQAAADDLARSAAACNADEAAWRVALRNALVHLEDFNARVALSAPAPVGPAAAAGEIAPMAADVTIATVGYLRGGRPPLAESGFWWQLMHPDKTRHLAMAAPGGGFDVVFVGSSTVVSAADPALFTTLDGRPSYNAALGGSGPEVQARWITEQIVPLADPDLIVLGVEDRAFRPWDVSEGSCAEPVDDWVAASALRAAAFGSVDALAGTTVAERFFGDPVAAEPTRPLAAHAYFVANFGADGGRSVYSEDMTLEQKQAAVEAIRWWSEGFTPCEERMAIAAGIVADLRAKGIEVVVVAMPTSDVRAAAFDPSGGDDAAAGRAVLDALFADVATRVTAAGGFFVDLSDHPGISEEMFGDTAHLNAEGSAAFTSLVAAAVAGTP